MRREPQLDFTPVLPEFETGSEVVESNRYFTRLGELRAQGCVIESVETVPQHNASWRIKWRKKRICPE